VRGRKDPVAAATDIQQLLKTAEDCRRKAQRNRQGLAGAGFYADKFARLRARSKALLRALDAAVARSSSPQSDTALVQLRSHLEEYFAPTTKSRKRARLAIDARCLYQELAGLSETAPQEPPSDSLLPLEIVRGTRRYIEHIATQAAGSYDHGWYDACAVMLRRLLETLLIECFETHSLASKITNASGDYLYLSDLADRALAESSWTLSRNAKKALPKLKRLGDQSAHSRRFTARKPDVDTLKAELRIIVEELLVLARFDTVPPPGSSGDTVNDSGPSGDA